MLGRALKMAFWVTYDHLGTLILANLIASAMVFPPLLVGFGAFATGDPGVWLLVGLPAATLLMAVALPLAMAGLADLAKELIDTRDGSVKRMFSGMRRYGARAIGVGFATWTAVMCLTCSVLFYGSGRFPVAPWVGYLLGALAAWVLAFTALMALFAVPALVQKKQGSRATIRLAMLLVVDNPLYAIGLAIQVIAVSVMLILPPVALLLYFSTIAVLLSSGYEQLARKYALQAYAETGVRDEQALRHLTVVNRNGRYSIDDEQDDYLNRGLRDALFPWKD